MIWKDVAEARWRSMANTLRHWRHQRGWSLSQTELAVTEQLGMDAQTSHGASYATISRYERATPLQGESEPRIARAPLAVVDLLAWTYGHSPAKLFEAADVEVRQFLAEHTGHPITDLTAEVQARRGEEADLLTAYRSLPQSVRRMKLLEMRALSQAGSLDRDPAAAGATFRELTTRLLDAPNGEEVSGR